MAYLKGSRVTGLSPKPLDVTGFTQSASEHLEGTYSQHEVLLADAFTITDDVTISDNLILAKLSDDGEAITLTGNATTTRTIAGSGSLEGSTFAQTNNASLVGMTGLLPLSGFSAGMIIKCHDVTIGSGSITTYSASETFQASGITKTISFTAGNKILAIANVCLHIYGGGDDVAGRSQVYDATNASPTSGFGSTGQNYVYSGASSATPQIVTNVPSMGTLSPAGTSVTIGIAFGLTSGATVGVQPSASTLQLFEIQQ